MAKYEIIQKNSAIQCEEIQAFLSRSAVKMKVGVLMEFSKSITCG